MQSSIPDPVEKELRSKGARRRHVVLGALHVVLAFGAVLLLERVFSPTTHEQDLLLFIGLIYAAVAAALEQLPWFGGPSAIAARLSWIMTAILTVGFAWNSARRMEWGGFVLTALLTFIATAFAADRKGRTDAQETRRGMLAAFVVLLLACAPAGILVARIRRDTDDLPARRNFEFTIAPSGDLYEEAWGGQISPDGTLVAFSGHPKTAKGRVRQVFTYDVENGEVRAIPGTEGSRTMFFWAADSLAIYFMRGSTLSRIALEGGAEVVGNIGEAGRGTANRKGDIVIGAAGGLNLIRRGETLRPLLMMGTTCLFPTFLPDGERVLFVVQRLDARGRPLRDLYLYSLADQRAELLLRNVPSRVEYSAGYLLFVRDGILVCRQFDVHSGRLASEEFTVGRYRVWFDDKSSNADFSVSQNGVLLTKGPPDIPFVKHVSHSGAGDTTFPAVSNVRELRLAYSGDLLALTIADPVTQTEQISLWRWHAGSPVCITCDRGATSSPVFSHDDKMLYYGANRRGVRYIYRTSVANPGSEEAVLETDGVQLPKDVSPDGSLVVFQWMRERNNDLYSLRVTSGAVPQKLIATQEQEGDSARISPDGKWLLYTAERQGIERVYVVPVLRTETEARDISGPKGILGRWRADGREIYFAQGTAVMAYDFIRNVGPRTLFTMPFEVRQLEVAPDGTFFLIEAPVEPSNTGRNSWTRFISNR